MFAGIAGFCARPQLEARGELRIARIMAGYRRAESDCVDTKPAEAESACADLSIRYREDR
jgi:hypothetical protein